MMYPGVHSRVIVPWEKIIDPTDSLGDKILQRYIRKNTEGKIIMDIYMLQDGVWQMQFNGTPSIHQGRSYDSDIEEFELLEVVQRRADKVLRRLNYKFMPQRFLPMR